MGKKAHRGKRKAKREIREERQNKETPDGATAPDDGGSLPPPDGSGDYVSRRNGSLLPTYEEALREGLIEDMLLGSSCTGDGVVNIADLEGNLPPGLVDERGQLIDGGPGGDWHHQQGLKADNGEQGFQDEDEEAGSISAPLKRSSRQMDTGTQITFSSSSIFNSEDREIIPRERSHPLIDSSDNDEPMERARPVDDTDDTDGPLSSSSSFHTDSSIPLSSEDLHQQPPITDNCKVKIAGFGDSLRDQCAGCTDCRKGEAAGACQLHSTGNINADADDDDDDWETEEVLGSGSSDDPPSSIAGSWKNPEDVPEKTVQDPCRVTISPKKLTGDTSPIQGDDPAVTGKGKKVAAKRQKAKKQPQQPPKPKTVIRNVIQAKIVAGQRQRRVSKTVTNGNGRSSDGSFTSTAAARGLVPANLRVPPVQQKQPLAAPVPAPSRTQQTKYPSAVRPTSSSCEEKSTEPALSKSARKRMKKQRKSKQVCEAAPAQDKLPTIEEGKPDVPDDEGAVLHVEREQAPPEQPQEPAELPLTLGGFQLKPKPGEVFKRAKGPSRSPSPPRPFPILPPSSPTLSPPPPQMPAVETPVHPSPPPALNPTVQTQQQHYMLQQQFLNQQQQLLQHQQMLSVLQNNAQSQIQQHYSQSTSPAKSVTGQERQGEQRKAKRKKPDDADDGEKHVASGGVSSLKPPSTKSSQEPGQLNVGRTGLKEGAPSTLSAGQQQPVPQFLGPRAFNPTMRMPQPSMFPYYNNQQLGGSPNQQTSPMYTPGSTFYPSSYYPQGMMAGQMLPPSGIIPTSPSGGFQAGSVQQTNQHQPGQRNDTQTGTAKMGQAPIVGNNVGQPAAPAGTQQPPQNVVNGQDLSASLQFHQMRHQALIQQVMANQQRILAAQGHQPSWPTPQQTTGQMQQSAASMHAAGQYTYPYWQTALSNGSQPGAMTGNRPVQQNALSQNVLNSPTAPPGQQQSHPNPPPPTSRNIFKHAENYLETIAQQCLNINDMINAKSSPQTPKTADKNRHDNKEQSGGKSNKKSKDGKDKGTKTTFDEADGSTILKLPKIGNVRAGVAGDKHNQKNKKPSHRSKPNVAASSFDREAEYQAALKGPHVKIEMVGNEVKATIKNVSKASSPITISTKGSKTHQQQLVHTKKGDLKQHSQTGRDGQTQQHGGNQEGEITDKLASGHHECYQFSPMVSAQVTHCLRGERLVKFPPLREAILKIATDEDQPAYHYTAKILILAATQRVSSWRRKEDIVDLCFGAPVDVLAKKRALDPKKLFANKKGISPEQNKKNQSTSSSGMLSVAQNDGGKEKCKNCVRNAERARRRDKEVGLALMSTIIRDLNEWAKYSNNSDDQTDIINPSPATVSSERNNTSNGKFQMTQGDLLPQPDQPKDDSVSKDHLSRPFYTVQDLLVLLWHRESERLFMIEQQILCTMDTLAKGHAIIYDALYHDLRFKADGVRLQFALDVLHGYNAAVSGLLVVKSQMDILEGSFNNLGADMGSVFKPIPGVERRFKYFNQERERINLMMMAKATRQPMSRFGVSCDNQARTPLPQRLAIVEDIAGLLDAKLKHNDSYIAQLYRKVLNLSYFMNYYASEGSDFKNANLMPCSAVKEELLDAFEKELRPQYKVIKQKMSVTPGFQIMLKNPACAWKAAVLRKLDENFKADLTLSLCKYVPASKDKEETDGQLAGAEEFPSCLLDKHNDGRRGKWCDIPDGPTCAVA